ncbi:elongation factor G, partial [Candidatus Falkowbacteria bacterium]|nr:elongation factor G [Candidatus Falkowbacteria bacterium]
DGSQGVEPQSETVWNQATKYDVPRIAFINKMDKLGADFFMSLDTIHERLSPNAVCAQLPIGKADTFEGLIDLLKRKAYHFTGDHGMDIIESEVPENMKADVEKYRNMLVEKAAEFDDSIMNDFLEGKDIEIDRLKAALRKGVVASKLYLVFCGSALKNVGVQFVLDAVLDYLPSPIDVADVKGTDPDSGDEVVRKISDSEPFSGLAFKVATDPFVGKLVFFRVYSGSLSAGSYVLNATTGEKERIGRIVMMHANSREEVSEVYAGDIAAAIGLKGTITGHTICDERNPIILESMSFPEPVIDIAVEPKTKADQEKMGMALAKLSEEDPTFRVSTNEETNQTIMSGMGELHLEILVDRMKREFGVEANVGKPQVAYRETITMNATGEEKYAKQSGGRGQYGHAVLEIEPIPASEVDENGVHHSFIFEEEVKGGAIPREFIPAVEKGVKEALTKGTIAGYPIVDVKVTLVDGSYHEVDSSEIAFKLAGGIAFRQAVEKAKPVLLEPVMKVEVITPEQYMGDVVGNLNARRGQISEMTERGMAKVVRAMVPLAQMFGYATDLRSMTQGRAQYAMEFDHYAQLPGNVAKEIAEGKK